MNNRKRKSEEDPTFPLNELNQDLLERVLSWLPTSSLLQLTSVCKRWKSMAESNTFKLACSEIPAREPWFFMVDSHAQEQEPQIVFDTSRKVWMQSPGSFQSDLIPVSSSGSLILFRATNGIFVVKNPVSNSSRVIKPPVQTQESPLQAIAMTSSNKQNTSSFKLVLVYGEPPNQLVFTQYTSNTNQWSGFTTLAQEQQLKNRAREADTTRYFLTKGGDVVSTETQRSPCKQYSSILTTKNGEELLYFISSYGNIVSCNLTRNFLTEYPSLVPGFQEYSIDLVEFKGDVHVVLLSEFLEHASVSVWRWDGDAWKQVAAMPPWMTRGLYGKRVDVNCCAVSESMVVSMSCDDCCCCSVMCDLEKNEWIELPNCGNRDFVSGFAFEPRIEALC